MAEDTSTDSRFSSRRRVVLTAVGLGALPWVGAQVANASSQIINIAGRQRMLSARTAKAYCQLGRGIEPVVSQKLLLDSVAQFDQALSQLRVASPTAEIKDTFAKLTDKWLNYKDLTIGAAPAKERAPQVLDRAEDLVVLANLGTLQLEQHAGRITAKLTNVCGRQRLLTQQIATYAFVRNWALPATQAQPQIAKRQQEYLQAVAVLQGAKETTPEIKRQLGEVANMWIFFEATVAGTQSERPRALEDLATASELILKGYDELTKLYSALA